MPTGKVIPLRREPQMTAKRTMVYAYVRIGGVVKINGKVVKC